MRCVPQLVRVLRDACVRLLRSCCGWHACEDMRGPSTPLGCAPWAPSASAPRAPCRPARACVFSRVASEPWERGQSCGSWLWSPSCSAPKPTLPRSAARGCALARLRAILAGMRSGLRGQNGILHLPGVTVLAQDHCYSDLLSSVLTTKISTYDLQ